MKNIAIILIAAAAVLALANEQDDGDDKLQRAKSFKNDMTPVGYIANAPDFYLDEKQGSGRDILQAYSDAKAKPTKPISKWSVQLHGFTKAPHVKD